MLGLDGMEESINSRYSWWVREALDELPHSFTIADPSFSIVFASRELLGYSREEVVGKNGMGMFQGTKTNRRSVMDIRQAVREERSIQLTLLNYHKNGTPLWVLFHMFPLFSNQDGTLVHFVALHLPKTHPTAVALGFCRRELSSSAELTTTLDLAGHHHDAAAADAPWKLSDFEKREATTAMANILSLLSHYSRLTGRLVSENRPCFSGLAASLNMSLARIKHHSFVLTDPHQIDIPIVYATDAFLEFTGYARHEVLGRTCRFLSGQETDVSTELQITNSIETGKACTVCILNYRKDGSAFWNSLHISPVRNASGKAAYFVEVQMNANCPEKQQQNLRPEMSVVAAVKVAVRTLGMIATTSNS